MPYASNRRFVERGLVAAVAWFGLIASTSAAAPLIAIPWSDHRPRVISLEEVLVDPVVTEHSAAQLLASLGVGIAPTAHAALVASGDVGVGGSFDVHVDGAATGATVFLMPYAAAPLSTTLEQVVGDGGEFVAEVEMTVSLASALLVHESRVRPVLCAWVTQVSQPAEGGAATETVTGVSLFGEAVSLALATAFVRQFVDGPAAQTMEQLPSGGIAPPTPPPPAQLLCCTCACLVQAGQEGAVCLAEYADCVSNALESFRQGLLQCMLNCPVSVFGQYVCLSMCLSQEVTTLGVALAACASGLAACHINVMATTGACLLQCLLSGTLP